MLQSQRSQRRARPKKSKNSFSYVTSSKRPSDFRVAGPLPLFVDAIAPALPTLAAGADPTQAHEFPFHLPIVEQDEFHLSHQPQRPRPHPHRFRRLWEFSKEAYRPHHQPARLVSFDPDFVESSYIFYTITRAENLASEVETL